MSTDPNSTRRRACTGRRTALIVAGAVSISALSACGGGATDTRAAAATDARALEAAVEGGWTTIASEGERFTVNGTQTVRYGSGSSWVTRSVTEAGECSNAAFGEDPLFGVVKACQQADRKSVV